MLHLLYYNITNNITTLATTSYSTNTNITCWYDITNTTNVVLHYLDSVYQWYHIFVTNGIIYLL